MKSAGVLAGSTALPGVASAQSSETPTIHESKVLVKRDNFVIRKTIADDEVHITKFYTEGPKQGQMELAKAGEAGSVSFREESDGSEIGSDSVSAESLVETSGDVIVERSKSIGGKTGESCDTDYCDGFTYEHRWGGFTFELVDVVGNITKTVLGTGLSNLIVQYTRWGSKTNLPSLLAGFLIGTLSGNSFTFVPYDVDKEQWWGAGELNPKVKHGAAEGWDKDYNDVTVFYTGDQHISFLNGSCGN